MADQGNKQITRSHNSGSGSFNVVSDPVHMPANGWITAVNVHAGGYQENVLAQFSLWDREQGGKLLRAGSQQTWGTEREWRQTTFPTGVPVRRDRRLRIGFWTPYGS